MEKESPYAAKPWLQFYDEGVAAHIDYPPVPLDQLLAASAASHPDKPALIFVIDRARSIKRRRPDKNRSAIRQQSFDPFLAVFDFVSQIRSNRDKHLVFIHPLIRPLYKPLSFHPQSICCND